MQESADHDIHAYNVFQLTGRCANPLMLVVTVDGVDFQMELDAGAAVSIDRHRTYCSTWPVSKSPTTRLYTYSGEILKFLVSIDVTASYHNQSKQFSHNIQVM